MHLKIWTSFLATSITSQIGDQITKLEDFISTTSDTEAKTQLQSVLSLMKEIQTLLNLSRLARSGTQIKQPFLSLSLILSDCSTYSILIQIKSILESINAQLSAIESTNSAINEFVSEVQSFINQLITFYSQEIDSLSGLCSTSSSTGLVLRVSWWKGHIVVL